MTDSDGGEDIEDLRRRTHAGSRLDEAGAREARRELARAIRTELAAIESGDRQKTVSVWDGPMAALLGALAERPDDLERVGDQLGRALDADVDAPDRSEVLRLALRLGFREAAPETMAALRTAVKEHAADGL